MYLFGMQLLSSRLMDQKRHRGMDKPSQQNLKNTNLPQMVSSLTFTFEEWISQVYMELYIKNVFYCYLDGWPRERGIEEVRP